MAVPFVEDKSPSVGGCTGGVNNFWLTVKGTAGATRLFLGPVGALLGAGAAATDAIVGTAAGFFSSCASFFSEPAASGAVLGGAEVGVALGALLSTGSSDV